MFKFVSIFAELQIYMEDKSMPGKTSRIAVLMLSMVALALIRASDTLASNVAAQAETAHAMVRYGSTARATSAGAPNSAAVDSGLVAYWKMDEGSGTTAIDSSGNGNTGALLGGPTYSTTVPNAGLSDPYSLLLNGTNQFVSVPDALSLKPMTVTVAAWVKFSSLTTNAVCGASPNTEQYIVFKRNSRTGQFHGYALYYGYGGITFGVDSAGGVQNGAYFAITPALDKWYHLAGVFARPKIRLYVDGVRQSTTLHDYPIDYGTRPVFIGRSGECGGSGQGNWDSYFNGLVDDVRIYDRELSAIEIGALANRPPLFPPLFLPLIMR